MVTLHKISTNHKSWDICDYGTLAFLSKEDELSLFIGGLDSGELIYEFSLTAASKYTIAKDHFHTFLVQDGTARGLCFSEINVGKKISRILTQLLPTEEREGEPQAKRPKQDFDETEWVIINKGDIPAIKSDDGEEAAQESVQSDHPKAEEGEDLEETDFSLFGKSTKKKPAVIIDEISGPNYFRHLSHVGSERPKDIKKAILEASCKTNEEEEEGAKKSGTFERATKRSTSFEFEPLQPQMETTIAAVTEPKQESLSIGDISSSSRFSSSSSFNLPEPPPDLDDHESFIFQINTFDGRSLHHVSDEEMQQAKNHPESENKRNLTSMFRNGLDLLLPKLQAMRQVSVVANISDSGEEEGFDEFDGLVFV